MNEVVTYFSTHNSRFIRPIKLEQVLLDFRSGVYADRIIHVRSVLANEGEQKYKKAKKTLPAIAFCGEFARGHAKENLVRYNNLLVFDIDHLTAEEMQRYYDRLSEDEFVYAFWVSPSGNGYKGLMKIDYQNIPEAISLDACYKKAFKDVTDYFANHLRITIDTNCSDFSRICYVCWDERLFINEQAIPFATDCKRVTEEDKKKKTVKRLGGTKAKKVVFKPVNVAGKNTQHARDVISSILKYLSKRNLSVTESYADWLRVGFAIANTFNYDLGVKYFLALSKLDKDKYNETDCIEKLQECYLNGKGDVTLGTIVEMARSKGYKGSSGDL